MEQLSNYYILINIIMINHLLLFSEDHLHVYLRSVILFRFPYT